MVDLSIAAFFTDLFQRHPGRQARLNIKTAENWLKTITQPWDFPEAWLANNVFNFAQQPHQRRNHDAGRLPKDEFAKSSVPNIEQLAPEL